LELGAQEDAIRCSGCQSAYPIVGGVANFLLSGSEFARNARWEEAQTHEARFWDQIAVRERPATDPMYVYWKKHSEAQYEKFLKHHRQQPPVSCLELGSGNIPRTFFVPAKFKFALDPLMSKQAHYFPDVYAGIVCLDAMGESIPLRDSCIDYAVLSNCLDHFSQPQLALREVFRVLRPDGVVFIALETFLLPWKLWHKWRDRTHPHRWSAREQKRLIAANGGKILEFEVDPPVVKEYSREAFTTPRQRLALLLKKMRGSWIFAAKAG